MQPSTAGEVTETDRNARRNKMKTVLLVPQDINNNGSGRRIQPASSRRDGDKDESARVLITSPKPYQSDTKFDVIKCLFGKLSRCFTPFGSQPANHPHH